MPRQSDQSAERYNDVFPTTLRDLLESHPKDGHKTTYKDLGEAVGVRQQTISQYAAGQTQPTADVVLRIAQFFGVSVDYMLTGISAYNRSLHEELGLSEEAISHLKRARDIYPQVDPDRTRTMPLLNELLSDKEFYEFLDGLHFYIERLGGDDPVSEEMKKHFKGLDIKGYFVWQIQTFVQEFLRKKLIKQGFEIVAE